jgi:hypothetical protein
MSLLNLNGKLVLVERMRESYLYLKAVNPYRMHTIPRTINEALELFRIIVCYPDGYPASGYVGTLVTREIRLSGKSIPIIAQTAGKQLINKGH